MLFKENLYHNTLDLGPKELVLLVKCLPYKCEDQGLIPSTYI